jgi:hypothetical protein
MNWPGQGSCPEPDRSQAPPAPPTWRWSLSRRMSEGNLSDLVGLATTTYEGLH